MRLRPLPPGGIDPDRLERSLGLSATQIGPGRYHVQGETAEYYVNLEEPDVPPCECPDWTWRERTFCKHVLAALREEGDPRIGQATATLVATLRAELKQAQAAIRKTRIRITPRLKRQISEAFPETEAEITFRHADDPAHPAVDVLDSSTGLPLARIVRTEPRTRVDVAA